MDSPGHATHSRRGWALSGLLLLVGVVYISSFWGNAAGYLPAPFDRWANLCTRLIRPWWYRNVATAWPLYDRSLLLWLFVNMVGGLLVPALVLRSCGRKLTDMGMGRPNPLGLRIVGMGVVLSIPFGVWIAVANPKMVQAPLGLLHLCGGLSMVPEHFLICGVYVALMLPGRRLPDPVPLAPVEGGPWTRGLRRLGLAQPATNPRDNRLLAWFGLTSVSLAAILVSGALFGMVHLGKGQAALVEVALSFPGGVAVAYMTLRSHSIWPAIGAHVAMNVIPMGLWVLIR